MTRPPHLGGPATVGASPCRSPARRLSAARQLLRCSPLPALVVILAVIVFPVAVHDLHVAARLERSAAARTFVGLGNYRAAGAPTSASSSRSGTRFYFTVLAVVLPMVLGIAAGARLPPRVPAAAACCAPIFMMPMMATPVAVALVWTMMFHPQLGVLNYLLSLVGMPAAALGLQRRRPSSRRLVMVEVWHWTPLVMLIVLGGLASLPTRALRIGA